jgi:hypothetical protein
MQLDEEHEPEVCTFLEENNRFVTACKSENLQLIIELEINLNNGPDIDWQSLLTAGSQLQTCDVTIFVKRIAFRGLVMEGHGLSGLFIGDYLSAWSGAADLSAERHIHWVDKLFQLWQISGTFP